MTEPLTKVELTGDHALNLKKNIDMIIDVTKAANEGDPLAIVLTQITTSTILHAIQAVEDKASCITMKEIVLAVLNAMQEAHNELESVFQNK